MEKIGEKFQQFLSAPREIQYDLPEREMAFDTVEFAVYCPKREQTVNPSGNNYAVFKRVLGNRK